VKIQERQRLFILHISSRILNTNNSKMSLAPIITTIRTKKHDIQKWLRPGSGQSYY